MTDTVIEPLIGGGDPTPEAAPATETAEKNTPTPKPAVARGGVPGVPALTIGTGAAVTAVSSAGLTGGPIAAMLVAGGLAAVGSVAAARRSNARVKRQAAKAKAQQPSRIGGQRTQPGSRAHGMGPTGPKPSASRPSLSKATSGRPSPAAGGTAKSPTTAAGKAPSKASGTGAAKPQSRVAQIRQARKDAKAAPRREKREQQRDARRQAADARREAKQQRTAAKNNAAPAAKMTPGQSATTAGRQGSTKAQRRDLKRLARRQAADARVEKRLGKARGKAKERMQAELAKARTKTHRNQLRKSAARYHGRRLASAVAAAPIGALAWLLTKLGFGHPQWGRRLYRHLAQAALHTRTTRDQQINQEHTDDNTAAAQQNPATTTPPNFTKATDTAWTTTEQEPDHMSLFDFRSSTEEMLQQAQGSEMGGMMAVFRSIETMPEAIANFANTFAVVAERLSPDEAPLDASVSDEMQELYKTLIAAADQAEELAKIFREKHETEIARIEDPRAGEHMWDLGQNDD